MESRYDIKEVEARIYKAWEKSGLFNPEICVEKGIAKKDAEPFSVVLPPPNVTGELHMGHAAMLVIEDIMVRVNRMKGKRALWVPGTDHAAIATQSKVEKMIFKEEKKSRHDLGREEFLMRVSKFAQQSHDKIVQQIKRLGASLDWKREAYTLDETRELAVRTAFQKMYDLGLIYRGNRIVNWDPNLQTTVSDEEIEWVEETAPLYYLKYGPFVIATARPETKFGDKYVVVHPEDKRYAKYKHGGKIELEWINGPVTATVIKDDSIDMEFGTGAMTITPWHDMADFDIAERHKLDMEQIIDLKGKLLPVAGEFAGQHIKKARPLIIEKLKSKGLVEKTEEKYLHRVATSSRGGGVIEPQILKQWFVGVNKQFVVHGSKLKGIKSGKEVTLKELMKKAVEDGEIKITPERFGKIYFNWIDNLRDWCISRQIWFGHRIPVWYCMSCGEPHVNAKIKSKWFLVRHGETDWNKEERAMGQTDKPLNAEGLRQIKEAAGRFSGEKIDLIISSDLERCRTGAEAIAKVTGAEIIFDKQLRERSEGATEGMLIKDRTKVHGNLFETYEGKTEDAESFKDLEERVMKTFAGHNEKHRHHNIVITTHALPIKAILKNIKKWDFSRARNHHLKNAEVIVLEIGEKCKKCGGDFYEQDPDTLDTWFSSGLWPFSTLGWPKETNDLKTYFPNSVLETGYDILFFWVARMILMSTCLMGEIPFREVYLHGLVRDAKGRKMSKSLNNGIDPLEMADKYGADATRLSLVIGASAGSDLKLSEDRIRGYRNFSTKIWNIARFIQMNKPPASGTVPLDKLLATRYSLLAKDFVALKSEITAHIENFEFHLAGEKLYHYIWHTLADEVIEAEKKKFRDGSDAEKAESYALLEHLLLGSLKMLHPFMPFVTEEIYGIFRPGKVLMVEKW